MKINYTTRVEIVAKDRANDIQLYKIGISDPKLKMDYNFVTKRAMCKGYKSRVTWTQVEIGYIVKRWLYIKR